MYGCGGVVELEACEEEKVFSAESEIGGKSALGGWRGVGETQILSSGIERERIASL